MPSATIMFIKGTYTLIYSFPSMKHIFCALLSALIFVSTGAVAQDYAEQARIREEHARKVAELVVTEGKINILQMEIDDLNRKEAGSPTKEEISPEITALEKESADITDSLPKVGALKTRIEADAENIRNSYFELKEYIQRLDRLQTQNVLKTIMSLAMETAQELQAFVTVSGKPVEIVKWAAEKAADPVVKNIVSYGGPEYYSRKMKGLSDQAAATTPELNRLKNLSGLSLEGWRSYMIKYEDKDIKGNNGLILGKVRVLLEQANKTVWSLVDLYNALDREAKSLGVDMDHMRERQKDVEKRLGELKQKDDDIRSPARKAALERKNLLLAQVAPLLQQRDSLQREISELAKKLGQSARVPTNLAIERLVEIYMDLRNKLITEIAAYTSQAERLERELRGLEDLHDKRQPMRERQEREINEVVGKAIEKELYPYTRDKTDTEALSNLEDYQQEWTKTHERHLNEQREALPDFEQAAARLEKEFNNPPNDPWSEKILRNAVGSAGESARHAIIQEIQRLQNAGEAPGQGRRLQMERLKAEIERLMNQPIPESPYGKTVQARVEGRITSGTLHDVTAEILSGTKSFVESSRKTHQNQGIFLESQKKEQEKTTSKYRQEIEERRNNFRTAAHAFLSLGRDHLSRLKDAVTARSAYASHMKSVVSSGILKETGESSYQIDPAFIEKTLGATPRTCQGIDRLRDQLSAAAASSASRLSAAQAADRQITTGAPPAPISAWGEINEPSLHSDLVALNEKIHAEREKITQLPYMPGTNALMSFTNSVTTDNASLIINYPSFFNKMQQTIRETDAMIKAATMEANILEKSPRIQADAFKRLQEWHKRLQDAHEADFGCFEPEHTYNQSILPRLEALKKTINKLSNKDFYTAANAFIAELAALKNSTASLAISESDGYARQVAALRNTLDNAQTRFKRQESTYYAGDAATIREHLHAIEENLNPHEAMLRDRQSLSKQSPVSDSQVQELYQNFVDAYGRGDIRSILGLLASDWQGGDGADVRDVEDMLINSFKVFDRIQYRISNFSAQPSENSTVRVSYSVTIIGDNSRQQLHHEESSQIVEEVGLIGGKPRILRTLSGNQWLH